MSKNAADPLSPILAEAQRLIDGGQFAHAEAVLHRALAARPDHPRGLHLLGTVAYSAHEYVYAEVLMRRALALERRDPDLFSNLGLALKAQGKLAEAVRMFRRAVSLRPGVAAYHLNLGIALKDSDDIESAIASFTRSNALDPGPGKARHGLSQCLFSLGRVEEAWLGHAWRSLSAHDKQGAAAAMIQQPVGLAPTELRGKRVLMVREQGLGDELFFLRYAPQVRSLGVWLAYCSSPALAPLLSRAACLDAILTPESPLPAHDLALFVGDLPLLAGGAVRGAPAAAALVADDRAREAARERLARAGPPPYLGVTWRAGLAPLAGQPGTLRKSVPLEPLARALAGWRGTAVVLQRSPSADEVGGFASHSGLRTADLSACNADLELMLGVLDTIDEYVGVSNTNMHLRAGLHKTARVLIPFPAEWRWTSRLERSPWFPDFPLYREHRAEGWEHALQRLQSDIAR